MFLKVLLPRAPSWLLRDNGEVRADQDPLEAAGPRDSSEEDPAASGDAVYVPPIDPVVSTDAHGFAHVLGGFGSDDEVATRMVLIIVERLRGGL